MYYINGDFMDTKKFFNEMAKTWDQKEIKDEKWFLNFISKYCNLKVGEKVLDLGCGTGVISKAIYENTKVQVIGVDIAFEMIKIARNKLPNEIASFICCDFYELTNMKFDVIICHNAYPHFMDPSLFAKKCYELLNDGGRLIIIHSISRKKIIECHARIKDISRIIKSPQEEAKNFLQYKVLDCFENDNMYLLALEKS